MPRLPRSALLAAWAGPALERSARLEAAGLESAVRAVQGDDEPHTVELVGDLPFATCGGLLELLNELARLRVCGLRLVLPAPGDPVGLPGPAHVNAEAMDAGECVLTVGGPPLALVPDVEEFGSAYETGHLVTWRVHASGGAGADCSDLAEAEHTLRAALLQANATLEDLDVASWRPDAAEQIQALRSGHGPAAELPPGLAPRSVRVLDLAWRVRGIVELASADDGAALSGWQAQRRAQALRDLDHVGRRALVAAVNAQCRTQS